MSAGPDDTFRGSSGSGDAHTGDDGRKGYDEEEGVCREPEQFEAQAAQTCPLAEPPPRPKREDCQATSLVISRKKRQIEIVRGGPGHSDAPPGQLLPRLEIVSGCFEDTWLQNLIAKQPAEVKCAARIAAGPCRERGGAMAGDGQSRAIRGHKGATFDVGFPVTTRSDSELRFPASSFATILPWSAEPRVYEVHFNTCSDRFVGEIAVYPDVEFGVGFEFKWQEEVKTAGSPTAKVESRMVDVPRKQTGGQRRLSRAERRKERSRSAAKRRNPPREVEYSAEYVVERKTPIKIGRHVSVFGFVKLAGIEVEPKVCFASFIKPMERLEQFVTPLFSVIRNFNSIDAEAKQLADAQTRATQENADQAAADAIATEHGFASRRSKHTILYPSIQVKFSGLWQELDDSPQCACCMRFALVFKPLIGISWTWNVTPIILRSLAGITGGSSIAIAEAKERIDAWLKDRGMAAFTIELTLEGTLEGEVDWDWSSGRDAKVAAPLDVNVKGKIDAKLLTAKFDKRVLGFTFKGDVDVGLKGETGFRLRAKYESEVFKGTVEWTGVKVTVAFKFRTCVSRSESCKPDPKKEYPEEISAKIPGLESDPFELFRFDGA